MSICCGDISCNQITVDIQLMEITVAASASMELDGFTSTGYQVQIFQINLAERPCSQAR